MSPEEIRSLRSRYHSLHEADRTQVIRTLGNLKGDADAARELAQLHEDCQWRSTRMEIVRALGFNAHPRALEFLFELALGAGDVAMAEAAIWALGQTHHPMAARFLSAFYEKSPPVLKAATAGALGQIPDRTLASRLLQDLQSEDPKLSKHLALALGELKVAEATPALEKLVLDKETRPALALCALVSLGKVSRDPAFFERAEGLFRSEALEYQIFTSARTQVQIRSQWRLEDYLGRFFESAAPHRSLPLELNSFAAADVREGLKLFAGEVSRTLRLCEALARVDFDGVAGLYGELFGKATDPSVMTAVLRSAAYHHHEGFGALLEGFKGAAFSDPQSEVFQAWFEAASLCLPQAPAFFKEVFESAAYRGFSEPARITAVNALVNCALTQQPVPARVQSLAQILAKLASEESLSAVRGRVLRGLARLKWEDKKLLEAARAELSNPDLTASVLAYLEACPSKASASAIVEVARDAKAARPFAVRVLRALACQEALAPESVQGFVGDCLAASSDAEVRFEALRFLTSHPVPGLLGAVREALKGDERLQLQAVIALKGYGDEASAEAVALLLASTSRSVAGRALDTLTGLPGLRAKRLVMDYLKEHPEDEDVCDKVVRCLQPPEKPTPYFLETVEGILAAHPEHPQWEGLVTLRDRFRMPMVGVDSAAGLGAKPGPLVAAVDDEIQKRLTCYGELDEAVKSTLRSAEMPFARPELFDQFVDKASSVLEYCKAVDLLLEKNLGRRMLFPKLEQGLHEFQNILHHLGLDEEYVDAARLLERCGLKGQFTAETLPAHKMRTVAQPFLNARVLNDRFKVLDGLRAWAVVLLLFARKLPGGAAKPPLGLKGVEDVQVVALCRRLVALQDVRNPAAHRQTFLKLAGVDEVRGEVYSLLGTLQRAF